MGADISVISEKSFFFKSKIQTRAKESICKFQEPGRKAILQRTVYDDNYCKGQAVQDHVVCCDRTCSKQPPWTWSISGNDLSQKTGRSHVVLLKIKPIQISLKDNDVPLSVATARRISVSHVIKSKDGAGENGSVRRNWRDERADGVVCTVQKKNGQIRICVDLKQLNKAVEREK